MQLVKDSLPIKPNDILLLACVRNEILRLPWFIKYHKDIGVDKFIFIDNGSEDGSIEFLSSIEDVLLFRTKESYAESQCGIKWQNKILDEYAKGHWVLVLDADEIFIYPDCEQYGLDILIRYLEYDGAQAMLAPLLDMYSKTAIVETGYRQGQPFWESCPYFDQDSYEFISIDEISSPIILRGGPRKRLFWDGSEIDHPSPLLKKIPFVHWQAPFILEASTHILKDAKLSRLTGSTLHFKFMQDFPENALLESSRKEHFANARQYSAYASGFALKQKVSAYYSGSAYYRGSQQLVDIGFMNRPEDYISFEKS